MNVHRMVVPWLVAFGAAGCSMTGGVSQVRQEDGETGVSDATFPLADPLNRVFAPLSLPAQKFFAGTCLVKLKDAPAEEQPQDKDVKPNTTTAELVVRYARNRSEVDSSFGIGGSLELSYGLAGGKAELKVANETKTRSDAIYLTAELNANLTQAAAQNCPLAISKAHTALLMEDQGAPGDDAAARRAARFMKNCGNSYVHLEQRGLIATIQLSLIVTGTSRKDEIEAAVEAGFRTPVAGAKATANLKALKEQFQDNIRFEALITSAGFTPTIDANAIEKDPAGALDKLLREAQEAARTGAIENAIPIAARVGYYADLEPFRGRFAKDGEMRIYTAEQVQRFTDAQAEIKALAKRMNDFLVPRRQLVRELDSVVAQTKFITTVRPEMFSYDGTQKSFDGTTFLPVDRAKADDFPDIPKYPPVAATLTTAIKAEMDACVENGEGGYVKCKDGPALAEGYAFVKKWRQNRPRPMLATIVGSAKNLGDAGDKCAASMTRDLKGALIEKRHVRYARHLLAKQLADSRQTSAWINPVTGDRCTPEAPRYLGAVWVAASNTFAPVCRAEQPAEGIYPAACVARAQFIGGKKIDKGANDTIWHDAFWGEELVIP